MMAGKKTGPNRAGGVALREKRGADYFRELGKKGGTRTKELHGVAHFREAGRLGYEATVTRYFDGDYAKFNAWLSAYGLYKTDPFPDNGAFEFPGDFPYGDVVLMRSDDAAHHGGDQGRTYVKGNLMDTHTRSPFVPDSLLEELGVVVSDGRNDGQVFFLLPNGWGLSALPNFNGSVKAIEWQHAMNGFTFEVVGLAPGQVESFDSLDEIPALLEALAAL